MPQGAGIQGLKSIFLAGLRLPREFKVLFLALCLLAITMLSHENYQFSVHDKQEAESPSAWKVHKQCLLREGPGSRKVSVLVLTTFRESHALYFLIVLCLFLLSPFSKCSSFNIRSSQVVTILEKSIAVI